MSQQTADTAASASRTANAPSYGAWTMGAWVYLPTLGATTFPLFIMRRSVTVEHGLLRWRGDLSTFRLSHANNFANFSSNPTGSQWIYFYMRDNGTNLQAGWKDIDDAAFTDAASFAWVNDGTNNPNSFEIGANPFSTTTVTGCRFFRVSVWNEAVTNANLLLAAATDLGYTTNINTHLPLTDGIASPWNDTSGNGRNWTSAGMFSNAVDPSLSSDVTVAASGSAMTNGIGTQSPVFSLPL